MAVRRPPRLCVIHILTMVTIAIAIATCLSCLAIMSIGAFSDGEHSLTRRHRPKQLSYFQLSTSASASASASASFQFFPYDNNDDDHPSYHHPHLRHHHHLHRHLQRGRAEGHSQRGRTVLTFLYLSVLGLCFLTPVVYYCRLVWEERSNDARIRRRVSHGLAETMYRNNNANDNDNNNDPAMRRKYMAERMARLRQLTAPVKVTLSETHFQQQQQHQQQQSENDNMNEEGIPPSPKKSTSPNEDGRQEEDDERIHPAASNRIITRKSDPARDSPPDDEHYDNLTAVVSTTEQPGNDQDNDDDEDDPENAPAIYIPSPGMPVADHTNTQSSTSSSSTLATHNNTIRRASGVCTICLSSFRVGSTVLWSSNPVCEHVFHEECILAWLLRSPRDELACPCCRQDFVVDPDLSSLDHEATRGTTQQGNDALDSTHTSTINNGSNNTPRNLGRTETSGGLPDILEEPVAVGQERPVSNTTHSPETVTTTAHSSLNGTTGAPSSRFPFLFRWTRNTNG